MSDELIANIPHPVKDSRYDRIMRRLWEMEQRLVFVEKALIQYVDYDTYLELKERMNRMEAQDGERKGIEEMGGAAAAIGKNGSLLVR